MHYNCLSFDKKLKNKENEMKKLIIASVMMLALLFSTAVFAQGVTYGINGEIALPMGDFGDAASMGFGGSVQGEYPFNEQVIGTASVGYLMWSPKDEYEDMDYSWSCIPIKAGAKYNFGTSGLYGIFEAGMYMFSVEYEYEDEWFGTISGDDSESEFGFAPGVGFQMPVGEGNMKLDISAQYETAGDFDFLGIDVGLRF
jgi:opacity protein-like surface antigen